MPPHACSQTFALCQQTQDQDTSSLAAVADYESTNLQALRDLAQEGGVRALFTGVTPRALKAAPACAIVLASYETLKALYADS